MELRRKHALGPASEKLLGRCEAHAARGVGAGGHALGHVHPHGGDVGRRLILALGLTLGFAIIEALAGFSADSLALLSDAGHMVTDSASLALAAFAARRVLARGTALRPAFRFREWAMATFILWLILPVVDLICIVTKIPLYRPRLCTHHML